MEVTNMLGTKRLVVEIPESQHRAIKAKALIRGISMREYVLEKLNQDDDDYDLEDLTDALAQSLQEVAEHKQGTRKLGTAKEFFNTI